jgi:hypothetical protein
LAFQIWAEKGEKLGQPPVPPVFQNRPAFKVGTTFLQNPLRKTLDDLHDVNLFVKCFPFLPDLRK